MQLADSVSLVGQVGGSRYEQRNRSIKRRGGVTTQRFRGNGRAFGSFFFVSPELVGANQAAIDKRATIGRENYKNNCNSKRQNKSIGAFSINKLLEASQKLRECSAG